MTTTPPPDRSAPTLAEIRGTTDAGRCAEVWFCWPPAKGEFYTVTSDAWFADYRIRAIYAYTVAETGETVGDPRPHPDPDADVVRAADDGSDLVAELRLAVLLEPQSVVREVALQAADEIERLRDALDWWRTEARLLRGDLLRPEAPR